MTAGTIGYVQLSQFLVVYGGILPLTIKYVLEESYKKYVNVQNSPAKVRKYEFFSRAGRRLPSYNTAGRR